MYEEDVLGVGCLFQRLDTQDEQWQKFKAPYVINKSPNNPKQKFLERVASQLNKAEPKAAPLASNGEIRTFGTLGVLRHKLRDRGTRFSLCSLNPSMIYAQIR
ncbi:MAG: hypothetical protein V7731_17545 [Amphritea sp.]